MAPWFSAFSLSPANVGRCSFSKRTSQDALIVKMGYPPTIPILQMIVTILALSECLPISTGGTTPATKRAYPPTNVLPSPLTDNHARAVIQNMEKLWIEEFENSNYFRHLPETLQKDIIEFLKSRTQNFLQGDQSLISQENNLKENMPSAPSGDVTSVLDTHGLESPEQAEEVKTKQDNNNNNNNRNNVTVLLLPKSNNHRSKRSYGRMRDLDNRISPYLSDGPIDITYTHVVPCVFADRYYCLNGGTCVFVGALDLKTCRCPMGYTGLRCEMIDQEYILSLLTNSIMFD